jgi:hypothetical protein
MSADWNNILGRVVPHRLATLDDLIPGAGATDPRGAVLAPATGAPPSAALWQRPLDGPSYVGIRITEPLAAPYKAAVRLAAMAIERSVEPVILSRVDASGFERFGFRVERLPTDEADAAAAEAELRKYWDLAIVIDGRELERLG